MIYKNFSEKASECMILDFFPQLRRGKPHSEQKLRIPFRNCLEKKKTQETILYFLCSTHASKSVGIFL